MRGAVEAGNEVTKIRVAEKKIGYCSACYYCRKSCGVCAKKDDMADILQQMIDADVIVLVSPVYFYSIDAQMKVLIDRTLARWTEVKNKEFYYIVTCADTDKAAQETTLACFRGYADCVEGDEEKGVIYGTGVYQPGEIKKSPFLNRYIKWESRSDKKQTSGKVNAGVYPNKRALRHPFSVFRNRFVVQTEFFHGFDDRPHGFAQVA